MSKENITIAEAYYTALGNKDAVSMERYLHPEVQFIGPMAESTGKEALLQAAKRLFTLFHTIDIRAKFGLDDQVVLIYDLKFPMPIGISRAASFMTFKEGLISRVELFYDARPFEKKRDEIFSS